MGGLDVVLLKRPIIISQMATLRLQHIQILCTTCSSVLLLKVKAPTSWYPANGIYFSCCVFFWSNMMFSPTFWWFGKRFDFWRQLFFFCTSHLIGLQSASVKALIWIEVENLQSVGASRSAQENLFCFCPLVLWNLKGLSYCGQPWQ